MRARRQTSFVATLAVAAGLVALPAAASAAVDHELPFLCGQQWTGTTRAAHSPSSNAIDFNRNPDLGQLVLASDAGVVSRVEDAGNRSYGKWIRIDHGDGYATLYAHLKAQWVVVGQRVDRGTPIGRVGDTGGVSGAHLHYEQRSGSTVARPVFGGASFTYGVATASRNCPDVPMAGDWDGDGTGDVGVFRKVAGAAFELSLPGSVPQRIRFGRPADQPVTGDWDGDGSTDVGVRRQLARTFLLRAADGTVTSRRFGAVGDLAVTGDWDGDGDSDLGTWRPGPSRYRLLQPDGTVVVTRLGTAGTLPVTGDWDGDGDTDLGVFDPATATFTLRTTAADGTARVTSIVAGSVDGLPVAGDWNADGLTDVGTWSPATATYTLQVVNGQSRTLTFGRAR